MNNPILFNCDIPLIEETTPNDIIGVALLSEGNNGGIWAYIDKNGNNITIPDTQYFNEHQVWGGVQDIVIDDQHMVKIPKFYMRRAIIDTGVNAGKEAWWISSKPISGYKVHSAFMHNGEEIDQIYIGKYQASLSGSKLESKPGVLPVVSRSHIQFRADAEARNVSGVSGFSLTSMYHWSTIQWLYLIENATMNSQGKTGKGRVTSSSAANVDASDVAQATYRGIVGLWGNVHQWLDGLRLDAGAIKLWDHNGYRTWVDTGHRINEPINTWPTGFRSIPGSEYDLTDIFFCKTYGANIITNATAPDNYKWNNTFTTVYPMVGGSWSNNTDAGLWCTQGLSLEGAIGNRYGTRLAKV